MKIKNPTNNKIEVQIKGNIYSIEPMGTLEDVPGDVATYWKDALHNFIVISDDSSEAPVQTEPETAPEKSEAPIQVNLVIAEPKVKKSKK